MATMYKFWSPACVPCKTLEKIIDGTKPEGLNVISINVYDVGQEVLNKYGVTGAPVLAYENDNGEIFTLNGFRPAKTAQFMQDALTNGK